MLMGDVKFYVQVTGGPPCEKKLLESSIMIGSEVTHGLQVQHPHLSSEHCTISLQSGVLSIIDHNSDLGVVINGKKIPPNKMIIILPTDQIKLGDLVIKIHTFEEESISEDQKTKILNLDDLVQKSFETKKQLEVDEDINTATLKLETKVEPKIETKVEIKPEPQKIEEPVKVELEKVKNVRDTETQIEMTSTNIKKDDAVDPLAKFKRGAKIHEKSKINVDVVGQSKKNLNKIKGNSKKYYFSQFDSVSFPIRIFAFFLDLILGFRLSLYLMDKGLIEFFEPFDAFIQFSLDFVMNLHPDTVAYAESVVTLSPYLVGFLILRVLGNVIFGVSVGQLLIGCWNDGNPAIKRLLGPIRELLGFVLAPLIVFDLPALFSKKTVKELLTMTGLECYSKTLSYVLSIILIPTCIALSFFAPLALEQNDFKNITIAPQSQILKISPELSSVELTGSSFLKLETSWNNPHFFSYTNFKLIKKENNRVYVPKVTVVAAAPGKEILRIERKKEFEWKAYIEDLVKMYPILKHRFETFQTVKTKNINKSFNLELKQIVEDSFELNQDNLVKFVLNYGPYLDPFLNFRKKITSFFQSPIKSIEFWKNSQIEYMVIFTESSDVAGKWRDFYIVPLSSDRVYVYQVSYLKDSLPKSALLMKKMLSISKVNFQTPNLMRQWKGAELNTAQILDYYSLKNLTSQEKMAMSGFLYRYYWNLGKLAASSEFDIFWADYTNVLQQVIVMLSDLNALERKTHNPGNDPFLDVGYDHLIVKLSELREAVKNRQTNFFQLIKYP